MRHDTRPIRPRLPTALLAFAVALCAGTGSAHAAEPTLAGVVYDLALERPIGVAETAIGVAVTSIAYPIALAAGKSELVVDRCIGMPGRYTFTRGLGDFSDRSESQCSPVGFSLGLVQLSFGLIERPLGLLFGRSPFSDDSSSSAPEIEVDVEAPRPDTSDVEIGI